MSTYVSHVSTPKATISERSLASKTIPVKVPVMTKSDASGKATMVLMAFFSLAFICCWSPYFLFDILDNFNVLPDTKERFYASVIIQNLPALNSAINPLIYCIFSSSICSPCK